MSDYITCSRCGVVQRGHVCPYRKPKYKPKDSKASKFRSTMAWTRKRDEIRQRDRNLCQVCMNNIYSTVLTYNFNKIEVHHIIPVEQDYNKRLDNDNLICLCAYHHKMAERGDIPAEELISLIKDRICD